MGGHVARMGGEEERIYPISEKVEGKWPLESSKRRWVDNIKMDLGEIWWGGMDWIVLAQDRNKWKALVKGAMNLRVS
jgi:hypothetical protein